MPIPFHDAADSATTGHVAFLKVERDPQGVRCAVFVVTGLGEPIEFAFSRVDVRASRLWRAGDAVRFAVAQLARVLFPAISTKPECLLMLASEVPPRLFLDDILLEIPACRVGDDTTAHSPDEASERLDGTRHLYWIGPPAEPASAARRLIDSLVARDLLVEPFERAATGLGEAFSDGPSADVVA